MQVTEKSNIEQLELVIKATGVGIWDWQISTGDVFCNENWTSMIGYSLKELAPIKFKTWVKCLYPEDLTEAKKKLEEHFKGEIELYEVEIRMKHKQGHYIWVFASGKTIEWNENGSPKRMIGINLDITQRKNSEQKLLTTSHLLDESQKIAKVGGWQLDLISKNLFWTTETFRIYEASPELFDPNIDAGVNLFLPESKQIITQALDAAINHGKGYDLELETYTSKGKLIDIRTTCIVTIKDGKSTKLTGIFQDISEQKAIHRILKKANKNLKQVNKQLIHNANYDPLTGLPNRSLLADRMEQAIAHNKRKKSSIAIAFIDLDGFKEVNDTYGHSIGDDLLCCITEQLKKQ